MNNLYRLLQLAGCALLGVALGSCQRTSYSFQPARRSVSVEAAGPAAAPAVAGIPAVFSAAGSLRKASLPATRPRALRKAAHRHRGNAAAARPQPAPRAANHPATRHPAQTARPDDPLPPVRHRSKGIALLLAIFLGGFGAHRFYLAYPGQGIAFVALTGLAAFLFVVGLVGFVFASGGYVGYLVAATVLAFAEQGWLISDLVRIILGDLKPKNGAYYPRFFQTRPDATPPTDSPK